MTDALEDELYRWRLPSPRRVAQALGVSRQHVKNLCRSLELPMVNHGMPGGQPRWRIPRETFRALRDHLCSHADHASEPRSLP